MSYDAKRPLSKRASMWESTFTLPNYTRPQSGPMPEPGEKVEKTENNVQQMVSKILTKEFAGMTLDNAEMDECMEFITGMVSQGYALSYNALKRLVGLWLTNYRHQQQTEYDEGYREVSFN